MNETTRLAEENERLLENGQQLNKFERITQARRHTLWARQWTLAALNASNGSERQHLATAAKHLRNARKAIEQAAE